MESFLFSLMALTVIAIFRYILTYIQSYRAIRMANKKAIKHIHKCETAFKIVHQSPISDKEKEEMSRKIQQVVKSHGIYFKEYHKDFNFNNLWISPTKWTLNQMYPNLTNTNDLVVMIDGVEL